MNRTHRRRLAKAGYVQVLVGQVWGWVPETYAKRILEQIEAHLEDVEQVKVAPRPKGRPPLPPPVLRR